MNLGNLSRCKTMGKMQGAPVSNLSVFHFLPPPQTVEISISFETSHVLLSDTLGIEFSKL